MKNHVARFIIGVTTGSLIAIVINLGFNITSLPLGFIIGMLSGGFCTSIALLL